MPPRAEQQMIPASFINLQNDISIEFTSFADKTNKEHDGSTKKTDSSYVGQLTIISESYMY